MAVKVIHGHTCDDCEALDLYEVPAPHQHVISIDGGPFKQLDFCAPSDRAVMDRIVKLYEERGRELEPKPKEEPVKTKPVTPRQKPKELEKAPASVEHQAEGPPARVWCPKPHSTEHGAGKFVDYKTRGHHAQKVHNGAEVWDIAWMDPHNILKVPCTSHAKCKETNLAFPNAQGLATHKFKCPLPRIDQGDAEA